MLEIIFGEYGMCTQIHLSTNSLSYKYVCIQHTLSFTVINNKVKQILKFDQIYIKSLNEKPKLSGNVENFV